MVTAATREGKFNKNAARRVRVAGKIPGVSFTAPRSRRSRSSSIPSRSPRILHSDSGHNTIFDVDVTGSGD